MHCLSVPSINSAIDIYSVRLLNRSYVLTSIKHHISDKKTKTLITEVETGSHHQSLGLAYLMPDVPYFKGFKTFQKLI